MIIEQQSQPIFRDSGYFYKENKLAGRKVTYSFWPEGVNVFGGSVMAQIGKEFGPIGSIVGSTVDQVVEHKINKNGPMVVLYRDIVSIGIHKSLINGKSMIFTLKDGSVFRVATAQMAYGGFKKIYPKLTAIIQQANPEVVVENL